MYVFMYVCMYVCVFNALIVGQKLPVKRVPGTFFVIYLSIDEERLCANFASSTCDRIDVDRYVHTRMYIIHTYIHVHSYMCVCVHVCVSVCVVCVQGLFKMDTVGDAYIVAAWLKCGKEGSESDEVEDKAVGDVARFNHELARKMLW